MSENLPVDLYVEDGSGGYQGIDPRTIASLVKDKKNNGDVQGFINIGLRFIGDWNCTGQNDFSRISKPRKKGDIFKVIGTETTIDNITYKPNDYIIFNIDVSENSEITSSKLDILLGYGNEGTKIGRFVIDSVPTHADLNRYENPKINSVIIVANDENHNNKMSFYQYINGQIIDYDYEVETYDDLLAIPTELDVPNFNFQISNNTISLTDYIGNNVDVEAPYIVYPQNYNIVKVDSDRTHNNETTYYKWENNTWVYYEQPSGEGWSYMFSRNEIADGVFKVKGSVPTYNDLPQEHDVGDVYNVLDTGANYVWTDNGWDKLSETVDLSNYYTKEEVNSLIDNIDLSNYYTKSETYNKEEVDEMIQGGGSLPPQAGNAGKFLSTNGTTASWEDLPSPVVFRDWD